MQLQTILVAVLPALAYGAALERRADSYYCSLADPIPEGTIPASCAAVRGFVKCQSFEQWCVHLSTTGHGGLVSERLGTKCSTATIPGC